MPTQFKDHIAKENHKKKGQERERKKKLLQDGMKKKYGK